MGYSSYSRVDRNLRASNLGYATRSTDDIFEQNKKHQAHPDMSPKGVRVRECLDSAAHPATIPIVLGLDVTGSMDRIPHEMIKDGLPHLMGTLTEQGVPDAAILFVAVGDHICDNYPLQIGQFESGDAELDLWLTRTYLEGNGGGNGGESYMLTWYFAAKHTKIDSFDKRKTKGFLFTVGDERCHPNLPASAVKEIMGDGAEASYSSIDLLNEAREKYHVYHLHIVHGEQSRRTLSFWKELLGDDCIVVDDFSSVSKVIAETILSHQTKGVPAPAPQPETPGEAKPTTTGKKEEEIIL